MDELTKTEIAELCGLAETELAGQIEAVKNWNINENIDKDKARVTSLTEIAAMNTQELSDAIRDADTALAVLNQEQEDMWALTMARQNEIRELTTRKKTVQSELLSRLVQQEP